MSFKESKTNSTPSASSVSQNSLKKNVGAAVVQAASENDNSPPAGLAKIVELAEAGKLEAALKLASPEIQHNAIRNARAVILMRLGRFEDAVTLLRKLVLAPNCTWMRPEIPKDYKVNFATSLLLYGKASGCRAILLEIQDEKHPQVKQLRGVFRKWYKTLSIWQSFSFRLWGVQPKNKPVTVDFVPGTFGIPSPIAKESDVGLASQPTDPVRLAV